MENEKDYLKDLSEIRSIMERSSRFISLSGLSGVMAGIYALIGAFVAYRIIYFSDNIILHQVRKQLFTEPMLYLLVDAVVVLALALGTGVYFTTRKARKQGLKVWDATAKRLIINLLIPLITGGLFVLILYARGYFGMLSAATLIFYGLALINASKYTLSDIRYLGFAQIVLGLIATILPGYSLLFWALGFGVMHVVYGLVMYFKYEK